MLKIMKTESSETMSKIKLIISLIAIGIALFGIFSCDMGGGETPNAESQFIEKLSGTWTLNGGSVTKDDADITDAFTGMEITFTGDKKFAVKNPVSPVWPASGSFTLQPYNNSFSLLRSDGVMITIDDLKEHNLRLSFVYQNNAGRTEEVSGQFIFNMTK